MTGWRGAVRRLRPYRRTVLAAGLLRLAAELAVLLCGLRLQRVFLADTPITAPPGRWELFLPLLLAASAAALTPLRVQTARHLGMLCGVLPDAPMLPDRRLWGRALLLRLTGGAALVLSLMPSLVLLTLAGAVQRAAQATEQDALPVLLTAAHLLILAVFALILPLRVLAARTALPFCLLRAPERPAGAIWREAFARTAGRWGKILRLRLCCLPGLLLPITAVYVQPVLTAAEMMAAKQAKAAPR